MGQTAPISRFSVPGTRPSPDGATSPWRGQASLRFERSRGRTIVRGGARAPLKLMRSSVRGDGRCELPLLHTAGGLVGGDRLTLDIHLGDGSQALITSVAAQKVYGTIGRSRRAPQGDWAGQTLHATLGRGADLEWFPQELVLYANGLYTQHTRVVLAPGASWLGAEVVRLGRTAAGEALEAGRWRSRLEISRRLEGGDLEDGGLEGGDLERWELVDRLELAGAALAEPHGMGGEPVFGSFVWVGADCLAADTLAALLHQGRQAREGLAGEMACGALDRGLVARYRGPSTTAARWWFTRLWQAVRAVRHLPSPTLPRVWPFQEEPLGSGGISLTNGHDPSALNPEAPIPLRQ
ncbi:MAG: urease accessory protein UreD [Cyanobacteriota bacterium]|nr:urease accessory protein UreD [Cyanobacteriota bacterium]